MPKILVIKLSSLGDLFHALPAVHLVKKATGATIDWVTQPEYVDVVKGFGVVDRVLAFPRRSLLAGFAPFVVELRRESYDLVLDMQGLLKSAIVGRLARAKRRIGPSFSREGAALFYQSVAGPKNKDRHAVEENLDVVRHLGFPVDEMAFPVRFPKVELDTPEPRIALVARSRWPTKDWPVANFIEVGKALQQETRGTIYLFGAPDDAAVGEAIETGVGSHLINFCGKTSMLELGSLMQEMDLLVTVDSGPMHMAAALGVPVVAVFGATDPKRTGPYGKKNRVITRGGLPCQPCFSKTCLRAERDTLCLADVKPGPVLEAARNLLASAD